MTWGARWITKFCRITFFNSSDVNSVPLSVTMCSESLYAANSLFSLAMVDCEVRLGIRNTSKHFEYTSTIIINVSPRKGPTKSMCSFFQLWPGSSQGCKGTWRGAFCSICIHFRPPHIFEGKRLHLYHTLMADMQFFQHNFSQFIRNDHPGAPKFTSSLCRQFQSTQVIGFQTFIQIRWPTFHDILKDLGQHLVSACYTRHLVRHSRGLVRSASLLVHEYALIGQQCPHQSFQAGKHMKGHLHYCFSEEQYSMWFHNSLKKWSAPNWHRKEVYCRQIILGECWWLATLWTHLRVGPADTQKPGQSWKTRYLHLSFFTTGTMSAAHSLCFTGVIIPAFSNQSNEIYKNVVEFQDYPVSLP